MYATNIRDMRIQTLLSSQCYITRESPKSGGRKKGDMLGKA